MNTVNQVTWCSEEGGKMNRNLVLAPACWLARSPACNLLACLCLAYSVCRLSLPIVDCDVIGENTTFRGKYDFSGKIRL